MRVAFLCVLLAGALGTVSARNETNAVQVFNITECSKCTVDKNSVFCSEAESSASFVSIPQSKDVSVHYLSIADKKKNLGPDGAKFCWSGGFGSMTNEEVTGVALFGSPYVNASVACKAKNLFYNQCAIPIEMSIILLSVGSVLLVGGTTAMLFVCGCCRCLNRKGDESKWGMCNRFCPWMPCADKKEKNRNRTETAESSVLNPVTEEEQMSSLFGRHPALAPTLTSPGTTSSHLNDDPNAPKGMGRERMSMNPLMGAGVSSGLAKSRMV